MKNSLYEQLGLTSLATAEDIRKAYFRLMRKFPPDQDPERFKAIKKAYDTLNDPVEKARYDSGLTHGAEIKLLLANANDYEEVGNWKAAANCYRRLLEISPTEPMYQNLLGLCYLNSDSFIEGIKVFEKLVEQEGKDAVYWSNLGYACWHEAISKKSGSTLSLKYLNRARQALITSQELDPKERATYKLLADVFQRLGQHLAAIDWLEKGLKANGEPSLGDLALFLELCTINILQGKPTEATEYFKRLAKIIPSDPVGKEYVAHSLAEEGFGFAKVERYDVALWFFREANRVCPSEYEKELVNYISDMKEAIDSLDQMKKRLITPIYTLAYIILYEQNLDIKGEKWNKREKDETLKDIFGALDSYSYQEVLNQIALVEQSFPAVSRLGYNIFSNLKAICKEEIQKQKQQITNPQVWPPPGVRLPNSSPPTSTTTNDGGNGTAGAIIGGLIGAAVGGPVGAAIGAYFGNKVGKNL